MLLFTTNASGKLDDVKIGTLGDITPLDSGYGGITFWDRDPSGLVSFCHNATGYGGSGTGDAWLSYTVKTGLTYPRSPCALLWQAAPGYVQMSYPTHVAWENTKPNSAANWPTVGNGYTLGDFRPDGLNDGDTTIQGVRTYDAVTTSWTTPDAYAGLIEDPASQKPYMWNRNNPVSYADPSGYEAACVSLNQNCISPKAADQIGRGLAIGLDFLFGHDVKTLIAKDSTFTSRLVAGGFLASNFFDVGPVVKVIGKMADLEHVARSLTLLDKLSPDLGSVAANRARNVSVIQSEMEKGTTFLDMAYLRTGSIKDADPNSFLQLERDTLQAGGYQFDFTRGVWYKPIPLPK
jgi:hypothetical protein